MNIYIDVLPADIYNMKPKAEQVLSSGTEAWRSWRTSIVLNVYYGDMPEAVYNTAVFFKNDYEDEWITDPRVKEMIEDVDHSSVIDSGVIKSPVLGSITPLGLSGGVKTLILVLFEPKKIFNVSTCGDNCAKWLLKIASQEDRTVNLRHIMDFGKEPFQINVLNAGRIVHSMAELTDIAIDYV